MWPLNPLASVSQATIRSHAGRTDRDRVQQWTCRTTQV